VRRSEPFRRDDDGFAVTLPTPARKLLVNVAEQMREVITGETADDDPAVARLFPPAYLDDPMRTIEFEHAAAGELRNDRLERFDVLARTAHARWLTDAQMLDWMRAINDARIVLGVRLDVTEDMSLEDVDEAGDDPERTQAFQTYAYLSALLETIVHALGDPAD
jgi:hypothetical protein